jgi:acylphosphatase
MNKALQRREVRYSGHVQGVGFRYTTLHIARRFDVTGYVKNLASGNVEVVVEGEPGEIEAFLQEVAEEMQGNIRDVLESLHAATGEFASFEVRY